MRSHQRRNIGFLIDMDGLLINSEDIVQLAFEQVCKMHGGTFTKEHHKAILGTESDFWASYVVNACGLGIGAERLGAEYYELFFRILENQAALMSGAAELLDWIERGSYKKCLVTSSGGAVTERILKKVGLEGRFDKLVTAELSAMGKPEPEPYILATQLLGIEPRNGIVLEDSRNGVLSGHLAGCTVVAVPTEFADEHDLKEADHIVKDLFQAIYLLESMGL